MFMKGMFMLFMSLGLGYILCVLAKKQEGILKAIGYTLGIAILALTFMYGLISAELKCNIMGKICDWSGMAKHCPMMKR